MSNLKGIGRGGSMNEWKEIGRCVDLKNSKVGDVSGLESSSWGLCYIRKGGFTCVILPSDQQTQH